MKVKTIDEVQREYASAVSSLTPPGYVPIVALLDHKGRKKRRDASAQNWSPSSGSVSIRFAEVSSVTAEAIPEKEPRSSPVLGELSPQLVTAVRALDAAERKSAFVALKWFRDHVLPAADAAWKSPAAGQEVIKDAIERGFFLTSKVPNPKAPAYPTTAIRLNRHRPEIQHILGSQPSKGFRPVQIGGEPLSETIIRDRR